MLKTPVQIVELVAFDAGAPSPDVDSNKWYWTSALDRRVVAPVATQIPERLPYPEEVRLEIRPVIKRRVLVAVFGQRLEPLFVRPPSKLPQEALG